MKFESVKLMIQAASHKLGVNNAYLAGMLDVSERTLTEWSRDNKQVEEIPPKGKRLVRLIEVIEYIRKFYPNHAAPGRMMSIFHSGRVPMDGKDEDTNSMSLIAYIIMFPEEHGWIANVSMAIKDYLKDEIGDYKNS